MNPRSTLAVSGLLCATGILLVALVRSPGSNPGPPGLILLERITGPDATAMVNGLHGRSVTPRENTVSRYGAEGGSLTVYRSTYDSDSLASSVAGRMRDRVRTGEFGFSHYAEIRESEVVIVRCAGQGRIHFFFAESHQVTWVEAEPAALPAAWTFVVHSLRDHQ